MERWYYPALCYLFGLTAPKMNARPVKMENRVKASSEKNRMKSDRFGITVILVKQE